MRRFAALLLAIALLALLTSKENFIGTFAGLCGLNVVISIGGALLYREPALKAKLNRWDEALAFACISLGAAAL